MKVYVTNENNRLLRTLNDGVDLTKWINDQIARGYISSGVSTLASLTDVNLTGVQPDYVLTYDALTSKWVPKFNAATGGLPAGSTGQVQFNNNGVFGASSNLVWDNTNRRLVINRPTIPSSSFSVTGTTGNNDIITIRDDQDRTRLSIPNSNDRIVLGNGYGNIDFAGISSAQHIRVAGSGSPMAFRGRGTTAASSYSFQFFTAESNTLAAAAGSETGLFSMQDLQFSPSTQSANYSLLRLNTTINQTGGSNGISRALWITPTLTSAANFRAIQFDNNTGWGLYGNGTANNYLAGNLTVGTTDAGSSRVTIQGVGATSANSALSVLNSNAVSLLQVDNAGNVGIGAINTAYRLNVERNDAVWARVRTSASSQYSAIALGTDNNPTRLVLYAFGSAYSSTGQYQQNQALIECASDLYFNATNFRFHSGNIGVGTSAVNASAVVDIQSTTRGFLLPRMTTTQKNAIATPATGLQVYDTTLNQINVYNGSAWVGVGSSTIKPVATVTATAGTIPAINLESAGTGVYEINMTNAGVSATFTAPTNPVNGGVYTFRFTNVTSHAIDFPSTFLDQTGNLFDGGTSYQINVGDFITGYFNGTNYICGKGSSISGSVATGQVAFGSATNTLSGSNSLVYNSTLSTFGINLSPNATFHSKATASISNIFRLEDISDNIIWNVPNSRFNTATINTALTVDAGSNSGRRFSFSGNNGTATKTDAMMALINNGDGPALYVQNLAGSQTDRGPFQVYQGSNPLITTQNNRFVGINTASPTGLLTIRGSGATSGTTGLLVQNSTPIDTFRVFDNGLIRLNKNTAIGTQSSAQIDVESIDANTNIVLTPKGTGAFIIGPAPDGGTTGGNSRGINSIDFQLARTANTQIAATNYSFLGPTSSSGITGNVLAVHSVIVNGNANSINNSGYSFIGSGQSNSINTGQNQAYATIVGGQTNTTTGVHSFIGGGQQNDIQSSLATVVGGRNNDIQTGSTYSFIGGGENNTVTSTTYGTIGGGEGNTINNPAVGSTISGGIRGRAYLYGQNSYASGMFSVSGDAQTSNIRLRNVVANATTELFLDGSSSRAVLTPPTGNTVRLWNATVQCIAVIANAGTSALTAGSCISQHYELTIKRTATATTLVGTPNRTTNTNDPHMSTADFLITADAANNSLKIEFQPPNGSTTDMQIRAVATVYLTELGY